MSARAVIELSGHIIDSMVLPRVMDSIMDMGATFHIEEFRVGTRLDESSFARLTIEAENEEQLAAVIAACQEHGASVVGAEDAVTLPAPADGVFPDLFYTTTNQPTSLLIGGEWVTVDDIEMDCGVVIAGGAARAVPVSALSPTTGDLVIEGMRAAHEAGSIVSFDLNYRAKLWRSCGGQQRAQEVMRRIVENVDVLVGNEEDLQAGLGIPGPEALGVSPLDPAAFLSMIGHVPRDYPAVRVVATTLREVHSANRHSWSAVVWAGGQQHVAPTIELDVYDRVGEGDGFASGLFYGLLSGAELKDALLLGWAHGVLVATYPGDTTMATLEQVRQLATGESARIQR
jgi:2-dehydro-3-deoxygluconokinase